MAIRITKNIRRFAMSRADRRFLAIAVLELAFARARHATQPVKHILDHFEKGRSHLFDEAIDEAVKVDLVRLSWAISVASAHVPWRSDCLLQAMAAARWMRRINVRSDFFLGVGKDAHGRLTSHAWLRHGDLTITGGDYEEFQVILGARSLSITPIA
jgi:hypothetical protein